MTSGGGGGSGVEFGAAAEEESEDTEDCREGTEAADAERLDALDDIKEEASGCGGAGRAAAAGAAAGVCVEFCRDSPTAQRVWEPPTARARTGSRGGATLGEEDAIGGSGHQLFAVVRAPSGAILATTHKAHTTRK